MFNKAQNTLFCHSLPVPTRQTGRNERNGVERLIALQTQTDAEQTQKDAKNNKESSLKNTFPFTLLSSFLDVLEKFRNTHQLVLLTFQQKSKFF